MHRYAIKIEYVGTSFHGWQIQPNQETVQGYVNFALQKLDPLAEGVVGAGRTDAGVHATGQVAHLDLAKAWDPDRLQQALNFHLKNKLIAIIACAQTSSNFHARFSATKRHYVYKILNRHPRLTLDRNMYWHVSQILDLKKMNEGAAYLIGKHDFTTFRSSLCQSKSPVKSIDKIKIFSKKSELGSAIHFEFEARSFLHNQIRSIIGTLAKVGSNKWHPKKVKHALIAKDRSKCGPVAPAEGLYLTKVKYKEKIFKKNS